MKRFTLLKTMLLLCALIVGSGSAWGDADLTLNFTSAWTAGADEGTEKVFTKTISETTYTIKGQGGTNFKFNDGYFYFGKSGAYIKLPIVDFDVDKIEVVGKSGASGSVVHNIFVGSTAVSTQVTGLNGTTSSFTIASGYESAGTQYILKVTSSHNAQITYVKYYRKSGDDPSTVKTPTFDPVGGTYTSAQSVAISCGTAGATIHYTTNGVDPIESDATYSSAVSITKSGTVLKAKAFKNGMTASSVASATYTIKPNAPTISAAGATVTITGDEGCTFYYTTNNTDPTSSSTEYTAPFDLNANCTIKAIAYDTNNNASSVQSFNYKYMPLNPKNINSGYFEKVTDASTLENGDAILIVYETDNVAMSTTQNNNNRGQADIIINDNVVYAPSASVQKLTLVKMTEEINKEDTDVFYFYTGSGYLYAVSNSSNHLKTEAMPDNNGNARATISITSGNAAITFKGSATHNLMRYNSDSDLFSCYDSGQKDIQIYKEVAHDEQITISSAKYATFCSPYKLDYSGTDVKAYMAKSTGSSVTLTEVEDGIVPANAGVVLYSETADTYNIPVTSAAGSGYNAENNELVGINVRTSVAADGGDGKTNYILSNEDAGVGFYKATTSGAYLAAHRAYLSTTGVDASRSFLGFDDETTGIETINTNRETVSGVQEYYNLNGQRVTTPTKGLYIVNGKKVIINK